jgi:hypothetical protein
MRSVRKREETRNGRAEKRTVFVEEKEAEQEREKEGTALALGPGEPVGTGDIEIVGQSDAEQTRPVLIWIA